MNQPSGPTFKDLYGTDLRTVDEKTQLFAGSLLRDRSQRWRLNIIAILQNLFAPWLFFSVVFGVMSFSTHYNHPWLTLTFIFLCFVVVCIIGYVAVLSYKKVTRPGTPHPPNAKVSWFIYLFLALLVAWLAAVICGDANYYLHMLPYYEVTLLNTYPAVDPARDRGQQVMDAGRVYFVETAKLDMAKQTAFKNYDMYCAVPIVNGSGTLDHYDFWAVGMNCCSGTKPDYACENYDNIHAHAGLRLLKDEERPFYRLAVQQAEAQYKIKAEHPIFFRWMQDPNEAMNARRDKGYRFYLAAILSFFALNLFCVTVASIGFGKLGYY